MEEYTPHQIENFITKEQIVDLVFRHKNNPEAIQKNTGPLVTNNLKCDTMDSILSRLKEQFKFSGICNTQIFDVTKPHILHNDWVERDEGRGLAFLMPLQHNGDRDPGFVLYDQYYKKGAVKLYGGGPKPKNVYYNTPLLSYEDVEYTTENAFDEDIYNKFLTHIKPTWVQGLSVYKIFDWKPTSLIVFHRNNIHSATDFTKLGITFKIGLSVFTYA